MLSINGESSSIIWDAVNLAHIVSASCYPVIFVVAVLFWVVRDRSKVSIVALSGSALIFSAKALHWCVESVSSVALNSPAPHNDQNVLIWLVYLHGINLGLLILGGALMWHFYRAKSL